MPGHGAQISARAQKEGYVQTSVRAQAPGTGTSLNRAVDNKTGPLFLEFS